MKTFTYPLLAKFFYRYANIPATILLLMHLSASLLSIGQGWNFLVSAALNLLIIYILNRYFLKLYKYFPFKIQINNEKIICSDFMWSDRQLEIQMSDVNEITGGIFSQRPMKPIYIKTKKGIQFGLNQHLKDFNKLLTIILSNINKELYDSILENMRAEKEKINQKRKR